MSAVNALQNHNYWEMRQSSTLRNVSQHETGKCFSLNWEMGHRKILGYNIYVTEKDWEMRHTEC